MSLRRLTPDDFETFTLELHPHRTFSSRSQGGATGSLHVFPRHSTAEKDVQVVGGFDDTASDDSSLQSSLLEIQKLSTVNTGTTDVSSQVIKYLELANSSSASKRRQQTLEMSRWVPPVNFGSGTARKNVVRQCMFPYYRSTVPSAHWSFTNYHTVNFFTASSVPADTALLYPNSASAAHASLASGSYSLTGAFTFDFYINPRYTTDEPNGDFKAGTVFHLSSSYAVSLVSGSHLDVNGRVDRFRMQLQLSHSADVAPSLALPGSAPPNALTFTSEDNSLERNRWHHVSIRWGTSEINAGSGSFYIDGVQKGTFVVPSASIAPPASTTNPDVLVIGNYYEGSSPGGSNAALFFASDPAARDGVMELVPVAGIDEPPNYSLAHPLNAEVHELKIYRRMLNDSEVTALGKLGPMTYDDLAFYLPPFFTRESPTRRLVGTRGGVLQTPFFTIDGSTDDPFNVALSFGVAGHDINLENYTRDFVTGLYPRLLNLTASQINVSTDAASANDFLYASASSRKRNVTILPSDNGKFKPNFRLLLSGANVIAPKPGHPMDHFINDLGHLDLSMVTLNDMVSTASLRPGLFEENAGTILSGVVGSTPEDPGVDPGEVLAIYQRTRDNSSNEVSFINISNLFYGNMVRPETFALTELALTGTDGKVSITLRDDGHGNLYRADALGEHAKWCSVGTLLNHEGIAVIKAPTLPFFGKDGFDVEFDGVQNVHTLKVHALAPAGQINSSSNPNFQKLSASLNANDTDPEFVYISSVQLHDDNLNVIMRANLAQPIVKRHGSAVKFLLRMGY